MNAEMKPALDLYRAVKGFSSARAGTILESGDSVLIDSQHYSTLAFNPGCLPNVIIIQKKGVLLVENDQRVESALWIKSISMAPRPWEANIVLDRVEGGLCLRITRQVEPGELLLLWLENDVAEVAGLPGADFGPLNKDDLEVHYCHICGSVFYLAPGTLALHLALKCDTEKMSSIWAKVANYVKNNFNYRKEIKLMPREEKEEQDLDPRELRAQQRFTTTPLLIEKAMPPVGWVAPPPEPLDLVERNQKLAVPKVCENLNAEYFVEDNRHPNKKNPRVRSTGFWKATSILYPYGVSGDDSPLKLNEDTPQAEPNDSSFFSNDDILKHPEWAAGYSKMEIKRALKKKMADPRETFPWKLIFDDLTLLDPKRWKDWDQYEPIND